MNKLYSLILAMLVIANIDAQTCSGYFELTNQSQVDNFLIENPSCESIDGSVVIYNYDEFDPIWNLDALSNLTSISENLEVYHNTSNSIDLSGLSNLQSIGGMLYISEYSNEPWIDDLSAFQNITTLSSLYLENLKAISNLDVFNEITTLDGLTLKGHFDQLSGELFNGLTSVNGDITFEALGITILSGFNSLESANQINFNYGENWYWNIPPFDIDAFHNIETLNSLYFFEMSLNSFQGFESLISCPYITLDILTNTDLPDFPSLTFNNTILIYGTANSTPEFSALTETSVFEIYGNYPTVSMPTLQNVNEYFYLSGDAVSDLTNSTATLSLPQLTTLNGDFSLLNLLITDLYLPNINTVSNAVNISNCPNLSICNYPWLCEKIANQPELVILENNGIGCNGIEEVSNTCGQTSLQGLVFADMNCDGTFNEGDFAIDHPIILNENGNPIGSSSSSGNYFIPAEVMSTYTIVPQTILGTSSVSPLTITTGPTASVYSTNFALCPDMEYLAATSACNYVNMRPGFEASFYFTLHNESFNTETIALEASISILNNLSELNSSWPYSITGNTINFNNITLSPGEFTSFSLTAIVDPSLLIGTPFSIALTSNLIEPIGAFTTNNPIYNGTIIGSYDPNDILVDRTTINYDNIDENGEWLQYQIRFQNTGNAPAQFINVINEQDPALDMSSLQIIGASHEYTLSFQDREMIWFFDNIQLPDSTSDPLGSQGFILFRIKTNPDISLEEIIESTAAIYFDYNEPVITNTATTIFYTCPEAMVIVGDTDYCDGDIVSLIATDNYDSYNWLLDNQIIGLDQDFTMTLSDGVYNLMVEGSTLYCQSSSAIDIIVHTIPDTPSIMNNGNTLYASGSGTFNWTFNGDPLNEFANSIIITESGVYGVSVTENGCTSGTSQNNFTYIHVDEEEISEIHTFPNPANDFITVQMPRQTQSITIRDLSGKLVYEQRNIASLQITIELNFIESGTYIIESNSPEGKHHKTITKL